MRERTPGIGPQAVFELSLLDPSGQPNLVIDSAQSHTLSWTLTNNAPQDLVITPFASGPVGPDQFHFKLSFVPGALTAPPTVNGWDVNVGKDAGGGITALFLAFTGNSPLKVAPGDSYKAAITYTSAIQEDAHNNRIAVTLTAGANVTIDGTSIQHKSFGPIDLTLVQAGTPTFSAPLSVDFVGRRTVLNDGQTANSFTFAVTNMTEADLLLTASSGGTPTVLTVWFDAAPNNPIKPCPWALAQVQDLDASGVVLALPSNDWQVKKSVTQLLFVPGNPQWAITLLDAVTLAPQAPVLFTFSGIKTDLDPGVTRMYLRYENVPGYLPGVLMGELEKSPQLYGRTRGQGLYISAGIPSGSTPPLPTFESGLTVEQFGDNHPSATFKGGKGVVVQQGDAAVSGAVSAASAAVSGELSAGSASVKGSLRADSATITDAISAASASISGTLHAGSAVAANVTISGGLSAGGPVSIFGAYESREPSTQYTAATDGFVVAFSSNSPAHVVIFYPNNPKLPVLHLYASTVPVPKGATFGVLADSVYWIPIGTTQTVPGDAGRPAERESTTPGEITHSARRGGFLGFLCRLFGHRQRP